MTDRPRSASTPPILDGAGFRLRPWTNTDVALLQAILAEPSVRAWWGPGTTESAVHDWLTAGNDTTVFVIEEGGRVVGSIQCSEEPEPDYRSAGIDLFLTTAAQGRGLGPNALRTLARWLFETRGHHRLTIDPSAANDRAIRAYRKVGFRPIGLARRYERGPDGAWHDGMLMDLLSGELT